MHSRLVLNLFLGFIFAALFAPVVGAQDPLLDEMKKALQELGEKGGVDSDPAFRDSKARWGEVERQIHAAEQEQDEALAGSAEKLKTVIELYRSRASSRASALDHHLYGRIMGLKGELQAAYEEFRLALQVDRWFFWSWDKLGVYHMKKEAWGPAADAYATALKINPDYSPSIFGLCQSLLQMRRGDEAIEVLDRALANPALKGDKEFTTLALLQLAEVHRQAGNFSKAIDMLSKVINAGTTDVIVYARRAYCNRRLERFADATADYEKILELSPKEQRYRYLLAECYRRLGRNHDAATALEKYLETADDVTDAQAAQFRADIEGLRKGPPNENPRNVKLSPEEWLNRLVNSPEVEKRREALLVLSKKVPARIPNVEFARALNKAILEALMDKDPWIRAKAVEQFGERLWWHAEAHSLWKFLVKDVDAHVRGMMHAVLPKFVDVDTGEPLPAIVPLLMKGIEDMDIYVFQQAHESLNRVTLAFIDRVLPSDLTVAEMEATRKKWRAWYETNRDAYRKFEKDL